MGQILVGQLVVAALYALVSVGFVLVYKSSKVLNFAQGQFVLVGGLIAYSLAVAFGSQAAPTIIVATVTSFVLGPLVYWLILRPLLNAGALVLVMLTIALSIVMAAVAAIIWGPGTKFVPIGVSKSTVHLGAGITVSWLDVGTIIVAVLVLGGLSLVLHFTRLGVATRAAAENPALAGYRGVNVTKVTALTWAFAFATATLAGISFSMRTGLSVSNADVLGFAAFPAVMVGGLDSVPGALVGAVILAEIQGLGVRYVGANFGDAIGYLLLLALLIVRPTGIFGSRDILRV
ncbi:branched-chain amino acid ABC transporter permease [Acidiferrimicrobium sp. IK]|uniref:branched-chain amino acid ABC transporter permease n=1 Tax=Acidiferrimicrobium sp. IK TaxID=2871700 RepID=UPI0021CB86C1|nr:branched-chain amino acid ABC transporter permease [Acidiferrimicrobium sp. IK]MCU4183834.1 branched-chain amino acid ABC transporter permease [Acidiferrimicrobium sp. IK]